MNALVIERYSTETYVLIDGLNEASRCRVRHKETVDEGLYEMEQVYFDLILVTIDADVTVGSEIVERIRVRANDLVVPCPQVIVLFRGALPVPEAAKCKAMTAAYLRRSIPQAIYDETCIASWQSRTTRHSVTISVEFRNGHHFFYYGGSNKPLEMGAQLSRLAAILASGCDFYSAEYLADELGVCRQSVKKYCCELRRVFASAADHADQGRRDDIVWMEKRPGGSICGLRANVIWS